MYSRYVVICLAGGEFGGAMGEVGEVLAGDGELRGPIRPSIYIIVIKVPTRISLGNTPIPICVRGGGVAVEGGGRAGEA